MKAPVVAVLTPYLPTVPLARLDQCVASVEAQTYPNVWHVVDEDTHCEGIPTMLNRMLANLDGHIDAWFCCSSSDYLAPDCIAAHVEAWLAHDRRPHLVHSAIGSFDERGPRPTGPVRDVTRADVLTGRPCLPSAALHDAKLWSLVGPYDEALRHGREDWVWFYKAARLLTDFTPLAIPGGPFYWWRIHPEDSLTGSLKWHQPEFEAGMQRARHATPTP